MSISTKASRIDDKALTIDGDVNNIGTSRSCSKHTGSGNTRGVVRMHMDRKIGVSLPNGTDEAIVFGTLISSELLL